MPNMTKVKIMLVSMQVSSKVITIITQLSPQTLLHLTLLNIRSMAIAIGAATSAILSLTVASRRMGDRKAQGQWC
jgi:hypothetical protein